MVPKRECKFNQHALPCTGLVCKCHPSAAHKLLESSAATVDWTIEPCYWRFLHSFISPGRVHCSVCKAEVVYTHSLVQDACIEESGEWYRAAEHACAALWHTAGTLPGRQQLSPFVGELAPAAMSNHPHSSYLAQLLARLS